MIYKKHEYFDYQIRADFAKVAPAPDMVARNVQKIDAARKNATPRDFSAPLHIPVDPEGCITGHALKTFLQEQGLDLGSLAMRVFSVERVTDTIQKGTDRDGEKHYDHGFGDCDLAMREHGLSPFLHYGRTTFVSPMGHLNDDRIINTKQFALSVYRQDCLYPLESSIGNLSSGFHLFLTAPAQALLAVAYHPPTTQKYALAKMAEDRLYGGYERLSR